MKKIIAYQMIFYALQKDLQKASIIRSVVGIS